MGNAVAPVNRNVMRVVPLATILIFVCSFVWLVGYNGKVLLFDVGVPGSTKNEFWLWVDSGFGEWVLTWVAMGFFSFRCSVSMVWSMMTWPILFDRIDCDCWKALYGIICIYQQDRRLQLLGTEVAW